MAAQTGIAGQKRLYRAHVGTMCRGTEQVLAQAGYDRLLIHSGRGRMRFQDDYEPPFRAHPHFVAWLPLPRNPDCLLEIRPGRRPRLWLAVPDDFWHAPPEAPEDWWAGEFEIETVAEASDWHHVLAEPAATAMIADPADFERPELQADLNPEPVITGLNELRTVKTDWQIACIRRANEIAVAGHRAAVEAFEAGASELDIHLAYLAAARHDPDTLPYGSIVALNEHAAILHYQRRDAHPPARHRSFLIDAGADCHGLAADVTRTWTDDDGVFAGLIERMDGLQQRLAGRMQTGRSYVELHREAHRGIAGILRDTGICDMEIEAMVEANMTGTFLPHGLGHFLGVQVHDVAGRIAPDGTPLPPPDAHPALRLTRNLAEGNVMTVEPGLYFIPRLLEKLKVSPLSRNLDWKLIDELIPFGGIRIEDDVVVRLEQPENLTREAWAAADQGA